MRESPAVEVVKLLSRIPNSKIVAAEPNAKSLPHELQDRGIMFADALTAIDEAEIVVLLVDHRQFNLIDPEALKDKRLVDTRGLWTWRKARKPDARIEDESRNCSANSASLKASRHERERFNLSEHPLRGPTPADVLWLAVSCPYHGRNAGSCGRGDTFETAPASRRR
jgi:hypothetical protein